MSLTNTILDVLKEKPLSVVEIARKTALSTNYVRTQLRLMEAAGSLRRVDDRVPIYYEVSPDNAYIKHQAEVKKAKALLMVDHTQAADNTVTTFVKSISKEHWLDLAKAMEICAIAISQLEEEGRLVDTL